MKTTSILFPEADKVEFWDEKVQDPGPYEVLIKTK